MGAFGQTEGENGSLGIRKKTKPNCRQAWLLARSRFFALLASLSSNSLPHPSLSLPLQTHRARAAADPPLRLDRVVDRLGRARLQGAHGVVGRGAPGLGGGRVCRRGGRRGRRALFLPAQSPRRPRDDAADLLERVEQQREADHVRQHDGRDRDLVQGHGCAEKGGEGKGGVLFS